MGLSEDCAATSPTTSKPHTDFGALLVEAHPPGEDTAKVEYEKDPERFEVRGSPITAHISLSLSWSTVLPCWRSHVTAELPYNKAPHEVGFRQPPPNSLVPMVQEGKILVETVGNGLGRNSLTLSLRNVTSDPVEVRG